MMNLKRQTGWLLALMMLLSVRGAAERSSRVFDNFNASNGLADNSAQTIHCTKTGRLVITTMGQINFFDGQKFSYIDPTEENLYPLKDYHGNYHLYFDHYHHIWLKNTQNVTCVNLTTEKFVPSIEDVFREFGVEKRVNDLFVDSEGIVWLLLDDGIYSVKGKKTYPVRKGQNLQDLEVRDGKLLLFYGNGVADVTDLTSGRTLRELPAYGDNDRERYSGSSVIYNDSTRLYQLRNGQKEAVLLCLDTEKWEWQTLLRMPYHLNNVTKLDSLLYISSEYGYWIHDTSNGNNVHIDKLTLANGQELETDVNVLAFDRQGGLWVGTELRGLLYSKPYNSPFNVMHWSDKRTGPYYTMMDHLPREANYKGKPVNCVYRDSRGWTWVGTKQGLQLYRKESDKLPKVITKNDGLLNNIVHSVVEDHLHNIWVGTSYGLSCVTVEDGEVGFINSYNQYDRIPNETFVNGHALCLQDGTVVMQSLDHVITFHPEQMHTILYAYPFKIYPKLIKLLVNGNDVKTGMEVDGNVILEKAISRTGEINLNYNQNSVTLTFSALNYFRPQQTYYRVRIKGLSDEWRVFTSYNSHGMVDGRGQLHLPLVGLHPGSYVVEIQASMKPDVWETKPYEWVVNVNQPWWRTTGLLALFGLLLTVLLGVNAWLYLRNANMRALRLSGEQSIIKRLKAFAEHCDNRTSDLLEPTPDEVSGEGPDPNNQLSQEFLVMMEKIMPYVLSKDASQMTMHGLSEVAGLDVQKLYTLVSSNIYKSHRPLARMLGLRKAEQLLITTQKSIGEISDECGFCSPNHMIAVFYRQYRMTPGDYRAGKHSSR